MLLRQSRRVETDSGAAFRARNMICEPFAKAGCCYDVAATHADPRNFARDVGGIGKTTDMTILLDREQFLFDEW